MCRPTLPGPFAAADLSAQGDAASPERFAITVDNQGFHDVRVCSIHHGTPTRLGTVRAHSVARLPALCADFRAAETDFVLQPIAGTAFRLEGESIFECDRRIEIEVPSIGVEFSRVWVLPREKGPDEGS